MYFEWLVLIQIRGILTSFQFWYPDIETNKLWMVMTSDMYFRW